MHFAWMASMPLKLQSAWYCRYNDGKATLAFAQQLLSGGVLPVPHLFSGLPFLAILCILKFSTMRP